MPRGREVLTGCAWQMFRTFMVGPPRPLAVVVSTSTPFSRSHLG
jgi:hypothetical protein